MTEADGITSVEGKLLAAQMGGVRQEMKDVRSALTGIGESLKTLARVEAQQGAIFASIERVSVDIREERQKREALDERIRGIEVLLPQLRETRAWVILGIGTGLSLIAGGVVTIVVQHFH